MNCGGLNVTLSARLADGGAEAGGVLQYMHQQMASMHAPCNSRVALALVLYSLVLVGFPLSFVVQAEPQRNPVFPLPINSRAYALRHFSRDALAKGDCCLCECEGFACGLAEFECLDPNASTDCPTPSPAVSSGYTTSTTFSTSPTFGYGSYTASTCPW